MLTYEDNMLLAQVGKGTPTGELFRQYWLPILLSSEIAEPDGEPNRTRILGEDLIAWRNTDGSIGLMQNACPHRGASMFFGRNEENGLRCVYHGWKFDTAGNCVDMPNEPAESNFKHKIKAAAYPTHEVGGMIWTYMGPRETPPPFPQLPWTLLPAENQCATKITEDCNWVQVLEGDLDTAHSDFLHFVPGRGGRRASLGRVAPSIDIVFTEYGFLKGARRETGDEHIHWRFYQFFMPSFVLLPASEDGVSFRGAVPMDDHHTMFWNGKYCPTRPMTDEERARPGTSGYCEYQPFTTQPFGKWRYATTLENNYLRDYEAERNGKLFSGIPPVKPQDIAMTESMGPIMDRTSEHLGTTDTAIIQMRRCVMSAAKALRDSGAIPPGVDNPEVFAMNSGTAVLPKNADWVSETRELMRAEAGKALMCAY